jgi:hypothetical protein
MSSLDLHDLSTGSIVEPLGKLQRISRSGGVGGSLMLKLHLAQPAEPGAGALLAHAILGVRDDVKIEVQLPEAHPALDSLIRSGIASALASHKHVHYDPPASPVAEPALGLTWTPGVGRAMAPMFGSAEVPSGLFGPSHAVFVNPHLTSEPGQPASITRLLRRWLAQTVAPGLDPSAQLAAIDAPAFAVDQLVQNVSEHAVTTSHPSVDSMVQVEVTGTDAGRALQITVLDTGAGVAATLRPKLIGVEDMADATLLGTLLAGDLPGWGRGRGFGLSALSASVMDTEGAELRLWSGRSSVVIDGSVSAEPLEKAEIAGTVVSARFPLPRR